MIAAPKHTKLGTPVLFDRPAWRGLGDVTVHIFQIVSHWWGSSHHFSLKFGDRWSGGKRAQYEDGRA